MHASWVLDSCCLLLSNHANGGWHTFFPALLSRLTDGLYQQLLKPNMRAQQPQGEELQQVHKAANRRAAFVLQIR
jgi:hypothetical protein